MVTVDMGPGGCGRLGLMECYLHVPGPLVMVGVGWGVGLGGPCRRTPGAAGGVCLGHNKAGIPFLPAPTTTGGQI